MYLCNAHITKAQMNYLIQFNKKITWATLVIPNYVGRQCKYVQSTSIIAKSRKEEPRASNSMNHFFASWALPSCLLVLSKRTHPQKPIGMWMGTNNTNNVYSKQSFANSLKVMNKDMCENNNTTAKSDLSQFFPRLWCSAVWLHAVVLGMMLYVLRSPITCMQKNAQLKNENPLRRPLVKNVV